MRFKMTLRAGKYNETYNTKLLMRPSEGNSYRVDYDNSQDNDIELDGAKQHSQQNTLSVGDASLAASL